jgi:hypothetical protein
MNDNTFEYNWTCDKGAKSMRGFVLPGNRRIIVMRKSSGTLVVAMTEVDPEYIVHYVPAALYGFRFKTSHRPRRLEFIA